jgi:hypothetical protein
LSSSSHCSQTSSQGIQNGTGKRIKRRVLKKKKKLDHQKKSLFPAGIRRFMSAVKRRMGGLGMGKIARCTDLGNDEPISAMAMPNLVMELKESFLTQSYVTIV